MRVTCEPLLTDDLWDYHWKMAASQIKDTVEKKGRKTYALPSILVLDVSRLWVTRSVTSCQSADRAAQDARECITMQKCDA
jgi:hypothetical protein